MAKNGLFGGGMAPAAPRALPMASSPRPMPNPGMAAPQQGGGLLSGLFGAGGMGGSGGGNTGGAGLFGNFGQANYSAAKLGLVGLINTLAQEGAKYDIKANAVAPIAATRMTEDILPPEVLKRLTPEYVAPVVGYLCTEEVPDTASVFIVGGGKVQRAALFQNEGVTFDSVPSVDDVAAQWSTIDDLSAPKPASFKL